MERELTSKRIQFLKKDYSRGFIADCGFKAMVYKRAYLESRLKVLKRHRQQDNCIHAGVIATMADHTAGYAAFSLVPEDHRILTIVMWDLGRCSKYSNYLPLPYFLIGIVNFPNGNFDNFDLRPPGVPPNISLVVPEYCLL